MLEKLYEFKNIKSSEWSKENTEEFCIYLKQAFWQDEIDLKSLTNMKIGDIIGYIWSHLISKNNDRFEYEFYEDAMEILNYIKSTK